MRRNATPEFKSMEGAWSRNMSKPHTIRIVFCGPGDVAKELNIAAEVVDQWNRDHFDSLNCGLRLLNWKTDATPSMAERGQAVINRELIDAAELIVAVFWRRFGTPTGMHDSGTAEEVIRAMSRDKPVMLYFSDIEAPMLEEDPEQEAKLLDFREKAMATGLPWSFRSRKQFRESFSQHLKTRVTELLAKQGKSSRKSGSRTIKQSVQGSGNVQVARNGNTVNLKTTSPRKPKIVIAPSPEHLTPAEQKQVGEWIEELAILMETVQGKTTGRAMGELWSRLKNQFKVAKYQQIESVRMSDVEAWYLGVRREIQGKARRTAADIYRRSKIPGIKIRMKEMGLTEEDYYPEIARRLRLRPFDSLNDLSPKNLDRVYSLVCRDSKR